MKKEKRKRVLKFIRKAVENLPKETYKAYHKYYQPKIEMAPKQPINSEGLTEEGKEPDMEPVMRFGFLEDCPVNHYRRCKKAYDDFGYAGINAYLMIYGFTLTNKSE